MKILRNFLADENGGPAAEFGMVLPLALIFLFGIIGQFGKFHLFLGISPVGFHGIVALFFCSLAVSSFRKRVKKIP